MYVIKAIQGNPMSDVCYGCNWIYETEWLKDLLEYKQTQLIPLLFTTEAYTPPVVEIVK